MTTNFTNNVLTVVTDITKEVVESGYASLKVKDDKGNELYFVEASKDGTAALTDFSFKGNTYVDGKLAATLVMPMGVTEENVKKMFADALLAAKKYTAQIAQESAEKQDAVNALFQ